MPRNPGQSKQQQKKLAQRRAAEAHAKRSGKHTSADVLAEMDPMVAQAIMDIERAVTGR